VFERLCCRGLALAGDDPFRLQVIGGHPHWTTNTGNGSFFAEVQSRLTAAKIQVLIEESEHPAHQDQVFMVCLTRISPAEIYTLFIELVEAHQQDQVTSVADSVSPQSHRLPDNLLIIGTMDAPDFDCLKSDHFSDIAMVDWSEQDRTATSSVQSSPVLQPDGDWFLKSRVGNTECAQQKLTQILGDWRPAVRILHSIGSMVSSMVKGEQAELVQSFEHDFIIYLANAWSESRIGLFHPSDQENLAMASDLAISQIGFPQISGVIKSSPALQNQLREILGDYPQSLRSLEPAPMRMNSSRQGSQEFAPTDLVCGMELSSTHALLNSEYQGQTYYFCSRPCQIAFNKAPQSFIR
jgi:Cu+-exporting ATPase